MKLEAFVGAVRSLPSLPKEMVEHLIELAPSLPPEKLEEVLKEFQTFNAEVTPLQQQLVEDADHDMKDMAEMVKDLRKVQSAVSDAAEHEAADRILDQDP